LKSILATTNSDSYGSNISCHGVEKNEWETKGIIGFR